MPNAGRARRAFTFIEILFSIIILGVGMIMIAGMLPVAIKQNADTRNDLTARIVADGGYAYLRTMANTHPEAYPETVGDRGTRGLTATSLGEPFTPKNNSALDKFMGDELMNLNSNDDYTPSGSSPAADPNAANRPLRAGRMMPLSFDVVQPDNTSTYELGRMTPAQLQAYPLAYHQLSFGDRIVSSEPRFQWLGFYRRDEASNTVKLVIVAMRQQVTDAVDRYRAGNDPGRDGIVGNADDIRATMPNEAISGGNGPFLVPVEIEDSLTEPDKVKFIGTPGTNAWDIDVAESGSFLIIAHSPPLNGKFSDETADLGRPFRNNGRVFRLANRREDLDAKVAGARVWELAPGYDLGPAGPGADGIVGTADDVADGSMNTAAAFDENKPPVSNAARANQVAQYPVTDRLSVDGTVTWAWLIGRGRLNPADTATPFTGPTQDLGVLSVEIPLP